MDPIISFCFINHLKVASLILSWTIFTKASFRDKLFLSIILGGSSIGRFIHSKRETVSWNFHFSRNLNDHEANDLMALLGLLSQACYSSSTHDQRSWSWILHKISYKSFFYFLIQFLSLIEFPLASYIWKVKVPSTIKAFVWSAVLFLILMICRSGTGHACARICLSWFKESWTSFFALFYSAKLWNLLFGTSLVFSYFHT